MVERLLSMITRGPKTISRGICFARTLCNIYSNAMDLLLSPPVATKRHLEKNRVLK